MVSLESIIEKLNDQQLEICFLEIVDWRKTGTLSMTSIVRNSWNNFKKENNQETFPIHLMPEPILFEICKRKYRKDGLNV